MQRWRILVKKKIKNKKEKKAYLYIFYTAFIGYAIELCIAKEICTFFKKKKVLLNSHRRHVALIRERVIKLPVMRLKHSWEMWGEECRLSHFSDAKKK